MGIPAVNAIIEMEDTKTRADMVLKVTGMQWKWQYEYPGTDVKFISTMSTIEVSSTTTRSAFSGCSASRCMIKRR